MRVLTGKLKKLTLVVAVIFGCVFNANAADKYNAVYAFCSTPEEASVLLGFGADSKERNIYLNQRDNGCVSLSDLFKTGLISTPIALVYDLQAMDGEVIGADYIVYQLFSAKLRHSGTSIITWRFLRRLDKPKEM